MRPAPKKIFFITRDQWVSLRDQELKIEDVDQWCKEAFGQDFYRREANDGWPTRYVFEDEDQWILFKLMWSHVFTQII